MSRITRFDVLDAYFAFRINDSKLFDGDVDAAHAALVDENPGPADTLEAWRARYSRGADLLKDHSLLVRSAGTNPDPEAIPRHPNQDGPTVIVDGGWLATNARYLYVQLLYR